METMSFFCVFPVEILENICWELDDLTSLKSIRLVCKDLSVLAARQLFYHLTLYTSSDSFDRLEAIANHDTFSRYVQCLTYSSSMFRYYPDWAENFESWAAEAPGVGLGFTDEQRILFISRFSDEQLQHAYQEWQQAIQRQGEVIGANFIYDPDHPSRRLDPAQTVEVRRLSYCLGRFLKLKSIQWQGQTADPNDGSFKLQASGSLEDPLYPVNLPAYVQRTLVARDPYGSKHRHGKQVGALLAAMILSSGVNPKMQCLGSLEICGFDAHQFLQLFQRDPKHWLHRALMGLTNLSITVPKTRSFDQTPLQLPNIGNDATVETFAQIVKAASELKSLKMHVGGIFWPANQEMIFSPHLKRLDLSGLKASQTTWSAIFEKLAGLQCISLSFVEVYKVSIGLLQGSYITSPWAMLVSSLLENSDIEEVKVWGLLSVSIEREGAGIVHDVEVDDDEIDGNDGDWSEDGDQGDDDDNNHEDDETDGESEAAEQTSTEDANEDGPPTTVAPAYPIQFSLNEENARQKFAACVTHTGWTLRTFQLPYSQAEGLAFTRVN